jgi:hypothetical protein
LAFPDGDVALRMGELLHRGSNQTETMDKPMVEVYVLVGRNGVKAGKEPEMTEDEKTIAEEEDTEGQGRRRIGDTEDDTEGQSHKRIGDTEDDTEGQRKKV